MSAGADQQEALEAARAALRQLSAPFDPGPPGEQEGRRLQAAYDALVRCLDLGVDPHPQATAYVFLRLAAHDQLDRMTYLPAFERRLAEQGAHAPVTTQVQLARIGQDAAERRAFLERLRTWGRAVEARAAANPIAKPPRKPGARLRVAIISNHLRQTTIGAFAWPLFQYRDRDAVELRVYSTHDGPADPIQQVFESWSDFYGRWPDASPRDLAERVAADGADVMIEFGDHWGWEAAAYRPAPLQLTWMGSSGPVGLPALDHVLLDPFLLPPDPAELIEPPLVLPRTWVVMAEGYFEPDPAPGPPPQLANGYVTFGTLNATYKYSRPCFDAWGRILAAVPQSRFLIVRPEAAASTFRDNALRLFATHGVSPDRIEFRAVRGEHLAHYRDIDIALDTFPVTGGTTTCESLWMGVPVVTLKGAAVFERISYSILANAGLGDLVADEVEGYVSTALSLAADPDRRAALRRDLRQMIRQGPLGRAQAFADDFYAVIGRAARERG